MISIILQQLIGIGQLSLPLVFFYYLFPNRLFSFLGVVLCCLGIGVYVAYSHYKTTSKQASGLKFVPSGKHMNRLNKEIIHCGLQPKDVSLRYAYTGDGVALTMFNTVVIDPVIWKDFQDDPECIKSKEVIEKYVMPGVPENKKILQTKIQHILSPNAQKFIFRHELGHVFHNYSIKRIMVNGIIGAMVTCLGLLTAFMVIHPLGGITALLLGILVGASSDLLLTYVSNAWFKALEEKKADMFAVQFSSKEEIKAAADFFEEYEKCAQEYKKISDLSASIPTVFLTGHPDGVTRAQYLKNSAHI